MLTRELKLRLTVRQCEVFKDWLWYLTGIYNWAIRKIELDAKDKIYYSKIEFQNLLANHSKKLEISSHTIQGILERAWISWDRCFKKIAKKPKLNGLRNKLNSIPFIDPIPESRVRENRIRIPEAGYLKFHKQRLPRGKIKCARVIKRASGWYLSLVIDAINKFEVKDTDKKVGVDTGFKNLITLSNGKKYDNERFFNKSQKRLAQAQRGRNKELTARLHERILNQRKDYNHKLSRKIVEKYNEINITKDNLRGQQRKFGKSIGEAGVGQLRNFIKYKGDNHGRRVNFVESKYTTMICSDCGALTGPTGLGGLKVRDWVCKGCGAEHDRDVNAAINVLNSGLGISLEVVRNGQSGTASSRVQ